MILYIFVCVFLIWVVRLLIHACTTNSYVKAKWGYQVFHIPLRQTPHCSWACLAAHKPEKFSCISSPNPRVTDLGASCPGLYITSRILFLVSKLGSCHNLIYKINHLDLWNKLSRCLISYKIIYDWLENFMLVLFRKIKIFGRIIAKIIKIIFKWYSLIQQCPLIFRLIIASVNNNGQDA